MKKTIFKQGFDFINEPGYRINILARYGFYNHMPDERYLRMKWKVRFGTNLNLDNPKTFNEKMQWLKIHDRRLEYTNMVDKITSKEYVSEIIGKEYIIPTIEIWDDPRDIDFNKLPDQFVLKCNHDSGGLIICRDKSQLDKKTAVMTMRKYLKRKPYFLSREWPYKNVIPKVLAEQYMDDGHDGLRDYKFFNFNGEAKFIYISEGLEDHKTARISFFDLEGNLLPFGRSDYKGFKTKVDLPDNFEEMIKLSNKLARAINNPFVRTDFYNIEGNIYFSEITFFPCGGMLPFSPPEWDEKIGRMLDLSNLCGGITWKLLIHPYIYFKHLYYSNSCEPFKYDHVFRFEVA